MNRSRRAGFIIDCQNADLASATRFWSQALGTALEPSTGGDVRLDTKNRDLLEAPTGSTLLRCAR